MEELSALADLLGLLLAHPRTGVLLALLAVAAAADLRTMRIPNAIPAAGIVYALAYGALHGNGAWLGLGLAFAGMLTGLAALLPLYVFRMLGAGDVKLMAMAGAFLGPAYAVGAALYALVAGGVLALAWGAGSGTLRQLLANLRFLFWTLLTPGGGAAGSPPVRLPSVGRLPCAVAILAGTLVFLVRHPLA